MKLKVHPWRIIWRFLIILLVVYVAIISLSYSLFFEIQLKPFVIIGKPWDFRQPLLLAILLLIGLASLIPALVGYYYEVENRYFLMKRFGKEYTFDYANIEFVDFEQSKKKNMIIFYSRTVKMRYLLGDKDGEVIKALEKNCKNLMTLEEFRRRHPEEKY